MRRFEDVLAGRIGAQQEWLRWMDPLCKWTFQIGYKLDSEAMSAEQLSTDLQERPVLIFDEAGVSCLQPRKMGQVVDFLTRQMKRP